MKSAPAIIQTKEALATFRNVSKSPTPRIAFILIPLATSLKLLTSLYNFCQLFCKTKPLLITMSISFAPALIESEISFFRVKKDDNPAGKPVETAATGIFPPKFFWA